MAVQRCETYSRPVLKATSDDGTIYLYQPRCKTWGCRPCANLNKLTWQAKIAHGYEWYDRNGVKDWTFVTVTGHEKLKTTEQCIWVWRQAWPKLSARMRRAFPGIKYVILPELHEDGRVHHHMIASGGMGTRWLKDNARQCGLGYMQKSDKVDDSIKAIMYVSKYISKGIGDGNWVDGLRRISTSRKWPELPKPDDFEEIDLDWSYLSTYPAEGLQYLAEGIAEQTGSRVKIRSP